MPRDIDAASMALKKGAARTGRATVIPREIFRPGPLRDDFERLAAAAVPMADGDILSLLLKYFFASVYPGAEDHSVSLAEISELLGQFCDLWSQPEDEDAIPANTAGATPLRMLADLPRAAHVFRSVANRPLPPALVNDPFLGFDLGSGSGMLLAAAWFQAKRNGAGETRLIGVERDPDLGERVDGLLASLGIGEIVVADARDPGLYARFPEMPVAFVANENLPRHSCRIAGETFCAIHAALFADMDKRLKSAVFFPEALILRDHDAEVDVVLSKNNRFQMPRHFRHLHTRPRSCIIEGRLTRLRQIGKDFRKYVPRDWLRAMPDRW